jgi:hypothetical protein
MICFATGAWACQGAVVLIHFTRVPNARHQPPQPKCGLSCSSGAARGLRSDCMPLLGSAANHSALLRVDDDFAGRTAEEYIQTVQHISA